MDSDKWQEAFLDTITLEKLYVKRFEEALEEIHDEAVKNAFKRLAKLSEIRSWIASLCAESVSLEQDKAIEPILEKLAEEREFLKKMK